MSDVNPPQQTAGTGNTQNTQVLRELPSMPALLGRVALKNATYNAGDPLPALSVEVRDQKIDVSHLKSYNELCGFRGGDLVPPTYMHLLTFPLVLKLATAPEFPLKAVGQIHLRNQFVLHRVIATDGTLLLRAQTGNSWLTSSGLEWEMKLSAWADGELLWSGVSTYLNRCTTGIRHQRPERHTPVGEAQFWEIPSYIGRRYAWVSRDYNPIHVAGITARMFGFRHAIAHGLWCKARCLAALRERIPDSGYSVDVRFFRPVFLPSEVAFHQKVEPEELHFSLFSRSGKHAHLAGVVQKQLATANPSAE